jgi:hypothetical protein
MQESTDNLSFSVESFGTTRPVLAGSSHGTFHGSLYALN